VTLQIRNAENVELLRTDFQHRDEPNFAWKSAVAAFQALPGLRGFWPCSTLRYTAGNQVVDLSGQQNDLTNINASQFGYYDLAPIVTFDGVNQYLDRVDGGAANWGDILGTEAFITPAQRGMTFGGWFNIDSADIGNRVCLNTKGFAGVGTTSWWFEKQASDFLLFMVGTGAALPGIAGAATVTFDTWLFLVCRFVPATSLDLIVGEAGALTQVQQGAGVPAALLDTNVSFNIGSYGGGAGLWMKGSTSLHFLCATALPDVTIFSLYQQTRRMFYV